MVNTDKQHSATTLQSGGADSSAGLPLAAMSIDVEDWFQVENLKGVVSPESWDSQQLRVERNTDRMLELMAERKIRATCFVLGWVARKCPGLVKRIAAAGHEIASHGTNHDLIYSLTHEQFRKDIQDSQNILQDLTGVGVVGYRAPSFSITDWAIDILKELGFTYDSSAFPTVAHDRYGKLKGMDAGQPIVEIRAGFYEVCVSVLKVGKKGVPWAGGGYFRLFPYWLFKRGVRRILKSNTPYVFYIHPWEIDPGQPRVDGLSRTARFRHYNHLDVCEQRFASLLSDFQWTTVQAVLDRHKPVGQ